MKAFKVLLAAAAAILLTAMPASAKIFRFGVKVGTEVTSMKFNKDVFKGENRAGFTGGVMAEFNIPIINLGFDVSAMYVHRNATFTKDGQDVEGASRLKDRDYIEIPVNVKYKFGLPIVGKFVAPYLFTGPSFAILTSKRAIEEGVRNKSVDTAWNVGLGVQVLDKVQVAASYGFGINKIIKTEQYSVRDNYWTITAAWLF